MLKNAVLMFLIIKNILSCCDIIIYNKKYISGQYMSLDSS